MQRKPYDVGNGLVCASFGLDGSWLSVGVTHPQAGLIELTGAPAFPVEHDGEGAVVRAHRARLIDQSNAAMRIENTREVSSNGEPVWQVQGDGWEAVADAWVEQHRPTVVQRHMIRSSNAGGLRIIFQGRLDRPGYAEITPGGPIPPALSPSRVESAGQTLRVIAPTACPELVAAVDITSSELRVSDWKSKFNGASLAVTWEDAIADAQLLISTTLSYAEPEIGPSRPTRAARTPPTSDLSVLDRIEAAAVRYTLGCTALEVSDGLCCILADHRLLPLSWTRDAYYQATLLLAHSDDTPKAPGVVRRHLEWLWGPGRDRDGIWRRSHLTTGAVKDPAYQVDQQLYPILELVDMRRAMGTWPDGSSGRWGHAVRRVWRDLPRDKSGLVPGEENPADDPSGLPYLLSSQLLLAYVARRVAEFEGELGLEDLHLHDDAARTLGVIREAFTCPGPFGDQWAYEADREGHHRLNHDANDVPTALASLWGLCSNSDPHWRATMQFAFSASNPSFVSGRLGGLGSAHTPGVWPLGDAQEWAVAVATADRTWANRVTERISLVASADGMLPETYHAGSGDWMARHWFAWPGSLVGLLNATFHHRRGPWLDS